MTGRSHSQDLCLIPMTGKVSFQDRKVSFLGPVPHSHDRKVSFLGPVPHSQDLCLIPKPLGHVFQQLVKWSTPLTCPGLTVPGHHTMVGSRMPPSNVVSFPHRNTPFEPPAKQQQITSFSQHLSIYLSSPHHSPWRKSLLHCQRRI